jgi:hypothetical protein
MEKSPDPGMTTPDHKHSLGLKILEFFVADPDPGSGAQCCVSGSGAFLNPGSGIRIGFLPDLGSQPHIFDSLVTIFMGKKYCNS